MPEKIQGRESDVSKGSVNVREIDLDEFRRLRWASKPFNIIEGVWKEISPVEPLSIEGASVCTAIYIKEKGGRMLAGHFPLVSKENYEEDIKDMLVRAKKKWFGSRGPSIIVGSRKDTESLQPYYREDSPDWYRSYRSFLERIAQLSKQVGDENLEAYLFGQNSLSSSDSYEENLTSRLIQQNNVTTDIQRSGVLSYQIFDHREPRPEESIDDTIYLPDKNEIAHYTNNERGW